MIPVGRLTNEDLAMMGGPPPPWVVGIAEAPTDLGAQLPTRDGRRIGNAVLTRILGEDRFEIISDAGSKLILTASEIEELFHSPGYCVIPEESPAYRAHQHQLEQGRG